MIKFILLWHKYHQGRFRRCAGAIASLYQRRPAGSTIVEPARLVVTAAAERR